jgi:hypothetical protein
MKTIQALAVLVLATLASAPVLAAEGGGNKPQTTRMSQCSAEAKDKGLKGDARKEHMSQCLRTPGSQAAAKACNSDAAEKGLKGQRKKEFVADCIKGKSTTGTVG